MNVYDACPSLENEYYKIRMIEKEDADDLWKVYSDKFSLPFFNSDNCHGSNFYCAAREDIENAIKYWLIEYYENKGFVRFSVLDQATGNAIGTIEMFRRQAQDFYDGCGVLRLDLRSDYEKLQPIKDILALVVEPFYDWFGCSWIITKAAGYAVDRIEALKQQGFEKSEEPLIGWQQDRKYFDYWICKQEG